MATDGQRLADYAIAIALISVLGVLALLLFGAQTSAILSNVSPAI